MWSVKSSVQGICGFYFLPGAENGDAVILELNVDSTLGEAIM